MTTPTPEEIFAEFRRRFPDRIRPIDESLIPKLFQKRRRVAYWSTLSLSVFVFIMIAFYQLGHLDNFELAITVFPLSFIYIIALVAFYRCPRCNEIPLAQARLKVGGIPVKKYNLWAPGLNLNPQICNTCGAILR